MDALMKLGLVCVLIPVSVLVITNAESDCKNVTVEPCKCFMEGQSEITIQCSQVDTLAALTKAAEGNGYVLVHTFSIFSSPIGYLPPHLFKGSKISRIQIYDTPLGNFSEGSSTAFTGLEATLTELTMRRCDLTEYYHYSQLESLSSLGMLDLSFNLISSVPEAWFRIPPRQLSEIYLKGNRISHIEDKAFATVTNLRVLDLSENKISVLNRNILPSPANHLEFLYLSYNELKGFPVDFFSEMLILHRLYFDHNHFTILPSAVFEPLWKSRKYLSHVDVLGNNIICDVSLCWLSFYENSNLTGSCAEPDLLRGRRLRSLWPWELHCNESLYTGDLHLPYRAKL